MKNVNMGSTKKKSTEEDSFSHISFGSNMDVSNPRLVFLKAINKRKYWYFKVININFLNKFLLCK